MSNRTNDMDFGDALTVLWQFPDAMEALIEEMKIQREMRFQGIRRAKIEGKPADWIEGEMLAYDEIINNISSPNDPPKPINTENQSQ